MYSEKLHHFIRYAMRMNVLSHSLKYMKYTVDPPYTSLILLIVNNKIGSI